jgi:epoxyqueuosine reductase
MDAVDDLIIVLKEDVRPEIRGTAAWSLGKIGGEKAKEALLTAKAIEKDEEVQKEIEKGLRLL